MKKGIKRRILSLLLITAMLIGLSISANITTLADSQFDTSIEDLMVNFLKDPIGIDEDDVRFSWQMESNVVMQGQKDYRIVVTKGLPDGDVVWDSGIVDSDLSTGIAYAGDALLLETRYYWTVTVTDIFGETHLSLPAYFETGTSFEGASWIYAQKPDTATLTPENYASNAAFQSGNGWSVAAGTDWSTVMTELFGYALGNPAWEGNNTVNNYARMGGNPLMRTEATLTEGKTVESARLYMTGLGNYEAQINGEKVLLKDPSGRMVEPMFAPGAVDYNEYVNYQTYDVTEQVKKGDGEVVVGAEMSKGYYAGRVSSRAYQSVEGVPNSNAASRTLALIGKLVITYTDGSTQVVGTNTTDWKSTRGSVLFNDYFNGEVRDGNRAESLEDWATPNYDDTGWLAVSDADWAYQGRLEPGNEAVAHWADEMTQTPVSGFTFTNPTSSSGEETVPNRVDLTAEQLSQPITMTYNPVQAENQILSLNFGQNLSGAVQLTMTGDKDTIVRIRHAEMLNSEIEGTGTGGRTAPIGSLYYGAMRGVDGQVSYYKLSGEPNEVWLPNTVYNGYQYVEISVVSGGSVTFNDIQSKVITSAYNRTSEFETNDAAVNRMYENGYWGQVSNWTTIPTDCNQRTERVGWTGDAQIFSQAAIYNFDAVPFYENYIEIMNEHNRTYDGTYANVMPRGGFTNNTSLYCGWSDAGIVIPWTMYQQTGDTNIIKDSYTDMDRYMDKVYGNGPGGNGTVTLNGQTTTRINMYDHNTYYGDWLAFKGAHLTFMDAVYQIYTTELMWKMAEAMGDTDMVAKYSARHAELKAVFMSPPTIVSVTSNNTNHNGYQRTGGGFVYDAATAVQVNGIKNDQYAPFDLEDGDIASYGHYINGYISAYMDNAQTALAWVLKLGLYRDEAHRQHLIEKLNECIKNEGNSYRDEPEYSLGVGFLGVNVILPMVTETGLNDTAFKMIFQDQVPGWMAPVKNGATTWWERWDSWDSATGFGSAGMNSFNHFSYGCINEWYNEYVLGFQQVETAPGFKEFVLQPGVDTTGRLTYAKGSYDSYYGTIKSGWTAEDAEMTSYSCTVPANTTATLYLPVESVGAFQNTPGVIFKRMTERNGQTVAEFKLYSGGYDFVVTEEGVSASVADGYVSEELEYETFEEFDSNIQYDGAWSNTDSIYFSAKRAKKSTTVGDSATFTFEGRAFQLVSYKSASQGIIQISVDGEIVDTVDLYDTGYDTAFGTIAYDSPLLLPGKHTVSISIVGKNSKATASGFYLDAINVAGILVPVEPIISDSVYQMSGANAAAVVTLPAGTDIQITGDPTGGTAVAGNGKIVYTPNSMAAEDSITYQVGDQTATVTIQKAAVTRYEETFAGYEKTGTWPSYNVAQYSGGSAYRTAAQNSTISFTFTGTGFDVISYKSFTRGTFQVKVEDSGGNTVTDAEVDCWDPGADTLFQYPVYKSGTLAYGTYKVTITVLQNKNVEFDAVDIYK